LDVPDEPSSDASRSEVGLSVSDIETAPDSLPRELESSEQTIDRLTSRIGKLSSEIEEKDLELRVLRANAATNEVLDKLIEPFADRAFYFMCTYSGGVGLIVLMHAWETKGFKLPDSTLDFLVGSTAVTVIGLVGMVLTGVFVGARK